MGVGSTTIYIAYIITTQINHCHKLIAFIGVSSCRHLKTTICCINF